MSHYKKFVKNLWLIGLVQTVVRFKGLILLPILTKVLGAESYGIWAQITVTISLLGPLLLLGSPAAMIRFLPATKDPKDIQKQIWSIAIFIMAVTLSVASIFLFFSGPIGELLKIPSQLIFLLAIILILGSANSILLSVLQAFQEMGKFAAFLFILATGETILIATSISLGYGLLGAVLSMILIRFAVFLVVSAIIFKKIGITLPDFARLREYLAFSIPTLGGGLSYWLVQASDRYLIVGFLGVLFVGYYAPAYALALLINAFFLPIGLVLPQILAQLFSEDKIQIIQTYLSYSLKYILLLTIPAAFGLAALSNQLLSILTTKEIATNASYIIPFVATSMVLYGIYGIFSQVLYLFKKTKIVGVIWVGVAILNIILNIILIPLFGILGAALTTLLAYIIALALTWYFSTQYLSFAIDWTSIGKSIIASSFMAAAIVTFQPTGLIQTLTAIVLGALFYGTLTFIFKNLNQKEVQFFKELLLSAIKK